MRGWSGEVDGGQDLNGFQMTIQAFISSFSFVTDLQGNGYPSHKRKKAKIKLASQLYTVNSSRIERKCFIIWLLKRVLLYKGAYKH